MSGEGVAQRIPFLRRVFTARASRSRELTDPATSGFSVVACRATCSELPSRARQPSGKIAKDGLKQLDSLCYECGDDAKENDGLQQVVRSALADVD